MSTLEEAWDQIDPEGHEIDSYVRLRLPEVQACAAYAARRIPEGSEAIILEVHKHSIPPGVAYPQTRGLSVAAIPLNPGRMGLTRLILSLTEPRFRDVFRFLGVDLLRFLASATSERAAVEALVSRLSRWQSFLEAQGTGGLSPEAVKGLFGELSFLREYLIEADPSAAIASWKGPQRSSHDFQFSSGSIEIKTTSAVSPSRFRVSNVQQLDDAHVSTLLVGLVLLQETLSEGESLPALVESVRARLSSQNRADLDDKLMAAGYVDAQSALYESQSYAVREVRLYRVEEGFPRLRETDVPDGVLDVHYDVAVGACSPFLADLAKTIEAMLSDRIDS